MVVNWLKRVHRVNELYEIVRNGGQNNYTCKGNSTNISGLTCTGQDQDLELLEACTVT